VATAAILNGGRASRFGGRDKGTLVVGGRPIRDRQVEALAPLVQEILIVGGEDAGPVAAPIRFVADRHPGLGPLGGLEAALSAAREDPVIVVACDMPCVTAPFFSRLLALAADVDAVVPRTGSGYHPLCAVYRRTCLTAVTRRLAARRLKVRELLDDLRVREVTGAELAGAGDPTRLLANVNTPADRDELEALLAHEL
jgi:molybdopterin-guanine dinucleotide biosynthesis protein A